MVSRGGLLPFFQHEQSRETVVSCRRRPAGVDGSSLAYGHQPLAQRLQLRWPQRLRERDD